VRTIITVNIQKCKVQNFSNIRSQQLDYQCSMQLLCIKALNSSKLKESVHCTSHMQNSFSNI